MNKVHIFTFLLLSTWISGDASSPQSSSEILKDALSWMTFRRNGVLMNNTDVESLFLHPLKDKYDSSDIYRAFVIAFDKGVVPRLTLNENQACDPSYTEEYKDPYRNAVVYLEQKKFTFKSYEDRNKAGLLQFCDYRQGLVCKPVSKKCECPQGSSMQPISPGSPAHRCLVKENEFCALIDLDHGDDPSHSLLASHLFHLIFNLEKPSGCQHGTQCRFKDTPENLPKCYANIAAPWSIPTNPGFGEECALDLYATPGSYEEHAGTFDYWDYVGKSCYNFGPPQSLQPGDPGYENKIGFAFNKLGQYHAPYNIIYNYDYMKPFFMAAVHPRTVPLRGVDFQNYYDRYWKDVAPHFSVEGNNFQGFEGYRCDVAKTQKMEELFKYFTSLEAAPPPGQDYVDSATPAELNAKMDEMVDLTTKDIDKKLCQVYRSPDDFEEDYYRPDETRNDDEYVEIINKGLALECVATPPADANGNDGVCQESPANEAATKPFVDKIFTFKEHFSQVLNLIENEDTIYNIDQILQDNPEPYCSTSLGPSLGLPNKLDGSCPMNYVCHLDFADDHDLFDNECNLKPGAIQISVCQLISKTTYGRCEHLLLSEMIREKADKLEKYAKKGEGDDCDYELEKALRAEDFGKVEEWNLYLVLNWMERKSLCDKEGEGVECSKDTSTCQCISGGKCDKKGTGGKGGKGKKTSGGGISKGWSGGLTGILILWTVLLY